MTKQKFENGSILIAKHLRFGWLQSGQAVAINESDIVTMINSEIGIDSSKWRLGCITILFDGMILEISKDSPESYFDRL